MTTNYPVVFEREESGAISAYVPGLPVYVAADTRAQAERAMRDLLTAYLEDLAETGRRLPRPTTEIKVARCEPSATVVIVGAGALLGGRTSDAKAAAARANGAKGGRPRKIQSRHR